jgi:hypothetical protein
MRVRDRPVPSPWPSPRTAMPVDDRTVRVGPTSSING